MATVCSRAFAASLLLALQFRSSAAVEAGDSDDVCHLATATRVKHLRLQTSDTLNIAAQFKTQVNVMQVWNTHVHITQLEAEHPEEPKSFFEANQLHVLGALQSGVGLADAIGKCTNGESVPGGDCAATIADKVLSTASSLLLLTGFFVPEGLLIAGFGEALIGLMGGGSGKSTAAPAPQVIHFSELLKAAKLGDVEAICSEMETELQLLPTQLTSLINLAQSSMEIAPGTAANNASGYYTYNADFWLHFMSKIGSAGDTLEKYAKLCIVDTLLNQEIVGEGDTNTPFNKAECLKQCWGNYKTNAEICQANAKKVPSQLEQLYQEAETWQKRYSLLAAAKSVVLASALFNGFNKFSPLANIQYAYFADVQGGPLQQWSSMLAAMVFDTRQQCQSIVPHLTFRAPTWSNSDVQITQYKYHTFHGTIGRTGACGTCSHHGTMDICYCDEGPGIDDDCRDGGTVKYKGVCILPNWCYQGANYVNDSNLTHAIPSAEEAGALAGISACGELLTNTTKWNSNFLNYKSRKIPAAYKFHPWPVGIRSVTIDQCLDRTGLLMTFSNCASAPGRSPSEQLIAAQNQLFVYNNANRSFQFPSSANLTVAEARCAGTGSPGVFGCENELVTGLELVQVAGSSLYQIKTQLGQCWSVQGGTAASKAALTLKACADGSKDQTQVFELLDAKFALL